MAKEFGVRLAVCAQPQDASSLAELIDFLYGLDAAELTAGLLERAPAGQVKIDSVPSASQLLQALRRARASRYVADLTMRVVEQVPLEGVPYFDLARLAAEMAACGETSAAKRFAVRIAATTDLKDTSAAVDVITGLQEIFADEAISQLLERCPIEEIELGEPDSITDLLLVLRTAGAAQEARRLAAYAAENFQVNDPHAMVKLAEAMRDVGAVEEAISLIHKVGRTGDIHGAHYSAILEFFAAVDSEGPRVAVNTLMYGPAPGKHKSRRWTWKDLLDSERD